MHSIKALFPQSLKNLYHLVQAVLANFRYGFPSRKIKVIGITGTDGKTTTSQMVAKILQEAGKKVALASTINFVIDGKEEKNLSHFTTESSFAVQRFIRKAVEAGCEYLVLEVSSHSLDQHRTWGVEFQTAVITNVTREHLDYHKTMEKYREAKKVLFKNVAKNKGTLVVNLDMKNPEEFLNFEKNKIFGYTCHPELVSGSGFRIPPEDGYGKFEMTGDNIKVINAKEIKLGIDGSSYKIQNTKYKIQLPGLFNVENALAAICVALGEGIDLEVASGALSKIKGVAGRMEAVENDLGVNILVDFALTPNALEKLYSLLFSVKKEGAKIIAIFGSCGDRDRGKRPIMGQVVSKYADMMILTNDEPYHEEPERIINEIFAGVMAEKRIESENCWRIVDRRQAIAKALSLAKPDDIICITGMGNFETMVVGDEKIPWNDRQVIEEELGKMNKQA
ncbi:MAG: UDP-N-acetylmuramoyl-L-alanyl-D-glutamate--2,6-diaminopimelate ligase [Candidatus Moranbacteria bacterium]|nr:UDP-N-acetylmuramoyl-L-alanyl-D-glutamate--2,6-diaminopimelate ligase [Candidatus Moranbacteria bacterium]